MPLAGTICCQTGQPTPFEVCEKNCQQGVCTHALPLLVNMRKNSQRREGIGVSSSVLGGCPRQYILGRTTDYYEDPEDYYARWFGSFGHHAIEMDGPYPGIIQEVRFYRSITVNGEEVEISGQPDWIDLDNATIADHKITGRKPTEARQEHIQQLNVYKWLVEGGEGRGVGTWPDVRHYLNWKVRKLELRYYLAVGKERHVEFDVPLWEDHLIEDYIRRALAPIIHAEKTGDPMSVGVMGKMHEWRANYCAFRHECNGSSCCMLPPVTQIKAP